MIFLAPHNDDEVLFGTYTLLRHKPDVVVCLRSFKEATWDNGPTYETRELETATACSLLGIERVHQLPVRDDDPDWGYLRHALSIFATDERVYAPLPESTAGHPHHDTIGEIAGELFPNVVYYATYNYVEPFKTVTPFRVRAEPGWVKLKREAMACYVSQATHPATQAAFNSWPIDEYLDRPED